MPRINNEEEALDIIRVLTDDFGVSKTALAKGLHISRVSLNNVINGKTIVTKKFIIRLNNHIDKLKTAINYE